MSTTAPPNYQYEHTVLCDHQGVTYAFAHRTDKNDTSSKPTIVFNVLDLSTDSEIDSMDWSGFAPVEFPHALRPVGASIIQVEMESVAHVMTPANAAFRVVSDDEYIYIFRLSTTGTILVDKMLPSSELDEKNKIKTHYMQPAWEVRFRESGKIDIPASDKDTLSYTNPDNQPFYTPTTELYFINKYPADASQDEDVGFDVTIIDGVNSSYWHLFFFRGNNGNHHKVYHYAIKKVNDNIFDLADNTIVNGVVQPTNEFKFKLDTDGNISNLYLPYAPAVTVFTQRETTTSNNGEDLTAQKGVRLALAQPLGLVDDKRSIAFLDIGVATDGQINSFPDEFILTNISPANYALEFGKFGVVTLPNAENSLAITSSFAFSVWIKPGALPLEPLQIIGDETEDKNNRSVFLQTSNNGKLSIGFGSTDGEVCVNSIDRVLTLNSWALIEAQFTIDNDANPSGGTFSISVNGSSIALDNSTVSSLPLGTAISCIGEQAAEYNVGTLDSVQIYNSIDATLTLVADLPFNEIDFYQDGSAVATTPDDSGKGNTGTVESVRIIPSDVPLHSTEQAKIYVDPNTGLRTYYGRLAFVDPLSSPTLLNSIDGLLHMYYQAAKGSEQEGLYDGFEVVHLDLNTQRASFVSDWLASSWKMTESGPEIDTQQSGEFEFLSLRAGSIMNDAKISIESPNPGLSDISFDVPTQSVDFTETWRGIPSRVTDVSSILSGDFVAVPYDAGLQAGTKIFYDINGIYPQVRMPVDLAKQLQKFAVLNFITRFHDLLPLSNLVLSTTEDTRNLVLTFSPNKTIDQEPFPDFIETWSNLPSSVHGFVDSLNAIDPREIANSTVDTNLTMAYLLAEGQSLGNSVSFILDPRLTNIAMAISESTNTQECDVTISANIDSAVESTVIILPNVPREILRFSSILNGNDEHYDYSMVTGDYSQFLSYWLAIAAGSEGNIQNFGSPESGVIALPISNTNQQIAASFFALFQSGENAALDTVPDNYSAAAEIMQSGFDAAGNPLVRGSQIFQGFTKNHPTNGAIALLQNTDHYTDGTANLAMQGTDGGWINQPPQIGLTFTKDQYIDFDTDTAQINALGFAHDMTIEAWVKPTNKNDSNDIQRLLTFNQADKLINSHALSQYALGYRDSYCYSIVEDNQWSEVKGTVDIKTSSDFSIELWFKTDNSDPESGDLIGLNYHKNASATSDDFILRITETNQFAVMVFPGVFNFTHYTVPSNRWTYVVLSVNKLDSSLARYAISLYVDGEFIETITTTSDIASLDFREFIVGSNHKHHGYYNTQFNGAAVWSKALTAAEIKSQFESPRISSSPELQTYWLLNQKEGSNVKNYSIYGDEHDGVASSESIWKRGGVYRDYYFSYGSEAVEISSISTQNKWEYIAASLQRGTGLQFSTDSMAVTENTEVLNVEQSASIEFWLQPNQVSLPQSVLHRKNSYRAEIMSNGKLHFVFTTDQGEIDLYSNASLQQNETAYFCMTFQSAIASPTGNIDSAISQQKYKIEAKLYHDGELQNTFFKSNYIRLPTLLGSNQQLQLGTSYDGAMGQLRLWSRTLAAKEINYAFVTRTAPTNDDGLLAAWHFNEMHGRVAHDTEDSVVLHLTRATMWRHIDELSRVFFKSNEMNDSQLRRYHADEFGGYGDTQFTMGLAKNVNNTIGINAEVDEIRLWNHARTSEQLSDEMYRALSGGETGLAGYWNFSSGSGDNIIDVSGHGNDGVFAAGEQAPTWMPSTAPISNELGAVYNRLGGIETDYNQKISGQPAVVEYADVQTDAYGETFSVMKRCYMAPQEASLLLQPGYKVGDLDTVFIGQIQTKPKILGYIEGAPPIPSENQTGAAWVDDITDSNGYDAATSAVLTVEQDTSYALSGGRELTPQLSLSAEGGIAGGAKGSQSAGIGAEVEVEPVEVKTVANISVSLNSSLSFSKEVKQSFNTTKTQATSLAPGGAWEPADQILNPEVGRRYIPDNIGVALVKSQVADVYASRIKATGQLAKLSIVPNQDIPEDINLINFPINPTYIKNGSLDGQVGLMKDPGTGVSYFRPLEAYDLKRRIEQQQTEISAYFDQKSHVKIATGGLANFTRRILPDNPSYDWKNNYAKRGIVNNNVWTANGGLHSDATSIADSYSESWGSVSQLEVGGGVKSDALAKALIGVNAELDFSASTTVSVTGTREKEKSVAVSLETSVEPDGFLSAPIVQDDSVSYTQSPAPGKVDAYRYVSFYLPPSKANFDFFNRELIDPVWLQQSQSPNAAALRDAQFSDNGAWRVLYRVTYVSRIPPTFQASPDLVQPPAVITPANLDQNIILTTLVVEELNNDHTPQSIEVGAALSDIYGNNASDSGTLGTLLDWWPEFLTLAEDYSNPQATTLLELRENSLRYILDAYDCRMMTSNTATDVRMFYKR